MFSNTITIFSSAWINKYFNATGRQNNWTWFIFLIIDNKTIMYYFFRRSVMQITFLDSALIHWLALQLYNRSVTIIVLPNLKDLLQILRKTFQ